MDASSGKLNLGSKAVAGKGILFLGSLTVWLFVTQERIYASGTVEPVYKKGGFLTLPCEY